VDDGPDVILDFLFEVGCENDKNERNAFTYFVTETLAHVSQKIERFRYPHTGKPAQRVESFYNT
jgi:hypothetical protein